MAADFLSSFLYGPLPHLLPSFCCNYWNNISLIGPAPRFNLRVCLNFTCYICYLLFLFGVLLLLCVYVFVCVGFFFLQHHTSIILKGWCRRNEGNVLFNDALNTFYLRLHGVRHMVKDHLDSERGNPLPPHRLLFPISSKGSFICTIPQTG